MVISVILSLMLTAWPANAVLYESFLLPLVGYFSFHLHVTIRCATSIKLSEDSKTKPHKVPGKFQSMHNLQSNKIQRMPSTSVFIYY